MFKQDLTVGVSMQTTKIKLAQTMVVSLISTLILSQASAEEKIIKQEKISFEKCLKVITTSQNKLSIDPEINDESDKKRIAVFSLVDGILAITCDGKKGLVTVSIATN